MLDFIGLNLEQEGDWHHVPWLFRLHWFWYYGLVGVSGGELYRAPGLKGPELEGCQNWRGARIGKGEPVLRRTEWKS